MVRFSYDAFISYAHEDAPTVDWLQPVIERLWVPGRRRRRLYRDRTSLRSGPLSGELSEALRSSRYLIVCCSTHAYASAWVNQEIRLFLELHQNEEPDPRTRVLAFLAGDTGAQAELPVALRELQNELRDEIFLPDLRGDLSNPRVRRQLQDSALALVAPLVDLRDKDAVRGRLAKLRLSLAALGIALTVLSLAAWQATRTESFQLWRTIEASRAVVPQSDPSAISTWALTLALADQDAEALQAIESKKDVAYGKVEIPELAELLDALGRHRSAQRAREAISKTPSVKLAPAQVSRWRAVELEKAISTARSGQAGSAFDLALGIEEPFYRGWALALTARAVLDREGAEALLRTARDSARRAVEVNTRINEESAQVDALLGATEAFAAAGDAQRSANTAAEALALALTVANPTQRAATLVRVAESLRLSGRTKEASHWADVALKAAFTITDPEYAPLRSARLARVALVFAELGRFDEALNLVRQQIHNQEARSLALAFVAEMKARAGELSAARDIAAECSSANDRLAGYTAVVFAVAQRKVHSEQPLVQEFLESRQVRLMTLAELPNGFDD
jgi:hypothetical protein